MRRHLARLAGIGLAALVGGAPASAGDGAKRAGTPPSENSSYVQDDDQGVRKALADADEARQAGDATAEARALQRLVEGPPSAVVAVGDGAGESGVFEGAGRVAHHRVIRTAGALARAYEQEYGRRAAELLAAGVTLHDASRLREAADLYLPTSAGRRASLLLADFALEAGDDDEALGWLERLEDLEEVAGPESATETARWRKARLDRLAVARAASAEALPRVRAALEKGEPTPGDLRAGPDSPDWPTLRGDASRARVPAPLREGLELTGTEGLHRAGLGVSAGDEPGKGRGARPSPWLPPQVVVSGGRAYASDGKTLRVFDVETQRLLLAPIPLVPGGRVDDGSGTRARAARRTYGWIEGHGLTVAGDLVWAYVAAERTRPSDPDDEPEADPRGSGPSAGAPSRVASRRSDHVVCLRIERRGATTLWQAGGEASAPGLPQDLRLFGAPLLYRGELHVVGLRGTKATKDRFEAYHVALDPETGAVRHQTFVGAGGPVRRRRDDELIPASCAASRGRVVVLTSLGVAAAVDARSGRTVWAYRYDRGRPDGDDLGQRLEEEWEAGERTSSFSNQPPILSGDRVHLGPTDARLVFGLFDRPRGRDRLLRSWRMHRTEAFRNLAVEQLAGVTSGRRGVPPTLVVVGQGFVGDASSETWTCVAGVDPERGVVRWERALPFGGESETYGTALVTETEVFVPTMRGIAAYRLLDGEDLPPLDREAIPEARRALLWTEERPFGNLVPVPGRGLLAINESALSFWLRPGR